MSPHPPDNPAPQWASREPLTPAPALWVRWCLECEKGGALPRVYSFGHTMAVTVGPLTIGVGYTPWRQVEGTAPATDSEVTP